MHTEKELIDAVPFLESLTGPMTFGRFLRVWREHNEWSQVDAAKKIHITKSTLCDFEKGRRLVSVDQARRMAKALGASEIMAVTYCLEDQLRRAKLPRWRVRIEEEKATKSA